MQAETGCDRAMPCARLQGKNRLRELLSEPTGDHDLNFNEVAHREGARALGVLFDLLCVKTDGGEAVSLTLGALGLGSPRAH